MGTTYRWQVVHLSKRQTVAEHSYFVTLLFLRFAEICELRGDVISSGLKYALLHDADEAWTGDIPGPIKRFMSDKPPIDQMMGNWASKVDKDRFSPVILALVKLADLVEAQKCLIKYGGNTHSEFVSGKYKELINQKLEGLTVFGRATPEQVVRLASEIEVFLHGEETFIDDYLW
jgi:5'-deoxynucleotidase YfbR-like HD superfamily hydrolase